MADPGRAVILERPERGRHLERGLETGDRRDGDHEASGRTKPDSYATTTAWTRSRSDSFIKSG